MKTKLIVILTGIILLFTINVYSQKNEKTIIGISKIVSHPALDAVEKGIQDELKALKINAEFDLQNANGEIATAASIANKFQSEKVRVAVGIATPTSQALVNNLKDIPVVFSAVTDPVKAGLVTSLDKGEKNVTGVSDMTPVKQQIKFLAEIKKIKKLGLIYSSHEDNAVALEELARKACKELGIEAVETTVSRSSEVKQAVQSIIDRVDGIYLSTDNTVISALSSITEVANAKKIPVMSADPSSAEKMDVFAAWGFDYYKMGRETGRMVAEILKGKKPEMMPVRFMTDASGMNLLLNYDIAKKLGVTFPKDIAQKATTIVSNGQVIKKK